MKVDIEGIANAKAAFAALVPKAQESVVRQLATAVYKDVQDGADKHTRTGALFQSVRMKRESDASFLVYHDLQRAPYAPFVVFGARPHIIRPNKKKALRWPSGGQFRFAKFVKHPGYKGSNYLLEAVNNAPAHFEKIIRALDIPV